MSRPRSLSAAAPTTGCSAKAKQAAISERQIIEAPLSWVSTGSYDYPTSAEDLQAQASKRTALPAIILLATERSGRARQELVHDGPSITGCYRAGPGCGDLLGIRR